MEGPCTTPQNTKLEMNSAVRQCELIVKMQTIHVFQVNLEMSFNDCHINLGKTMHVLCHLHIVSVLRYAYANFHA